jgi:lactose/L-arabinose transport system permease protein
MKFAGLGNIDRLLNDPIFFTALTNTFIFLFVQVPIMIVLALIMASCLNMPNLKFRGFLRTAVFLPCVTSLVAYSVLFKSMFSYDGLINSILLKTGLVSESVPWLSDPFWAKVVVIRHHLALDRLQHDLLPRGDAEHRQVDL